MCGGGWESGRFAGPSRLTGDGAPGSSRPTGGYINITGKYGGICCTTNSETSIKFRGQVVARGAERQRRFTKGPKTGGRSQDTFCFARATAAASEVPRLDAALAYRKGVVTWGS